MEPFGLFNLLKTLLPNTTQPPETPAQSGPQTPQSPAPNPPEISSYPQPNNACWEFMVKHDERAKNVKKKF